MLSQINYKIVKKRINKPDLLIQKNYNKKVSFISLIFFLVTIFMPTVYTTEWISSTQSDFNEGEYFQTFYNTTDNFVQLNTIHTTGNYTSKIFDAGTNAQWNNILWWRGYGFELPNYKASENYVVHPSNMTGNVLLLHMNEASGRIVDYSGEGNSGITYGAVTYGAEGKLNTALSFDGVDDYVIFGDTLNFNSSDPFSVMFWWKSDSNTNMIPISKAKEGGNYRGWYIYFYSGNRVGFRLINDLTSLIKVSVEQQYYDNEWHFCTVVYNGNSKASGVKIYIDGIERDLTLEKDTLNGDTTNNIDLQVSGRNGSHYLFKGIIDEVAVFNRTVTSEEVLDYYKRGVLRLNLSVRTCDDANCSGESWIDVNDTSPQNLNVANNRYFQYKFKFRTDNATYTPELYNVTVDYTVSNAPPTVTLNAPENNSYIAVSYSLLNATVYDSDLDNMTVWFYGDGSLLTTFYNKTNGTALTHNWTSLSEGLHNWTVMANDGTVNNTNKYYYFTIDLTNPTLIVSYPVNGTTYKLHSYETTLDLNYTATDINLDSCWFTNVTGENEILANCNNRTINIPDQIDDNNYNITVYVNDSAGNLNSSRIFFTTDYSQGYPNNTQINMSGSEKVAAWFDINTSTVCADDWCENVSVILIYDSDNCQLANGYQVSYVKGDYDETDTITQNWVARCNVVGAYTFTVNYTVQNGSFDSTSATISISETYAKTVYEQTALGDYYSRGDNMTIAVSLEDSDGNPVTNESVYVDIFYPNLTQWVDNLQLTETALGLYTAKQDIPSNAPYGDYTVYYIGNDFVAVRVFRVTKMKELAEKINQTTYSNHLLLTQIQSDVIYLYNRENCTNYVSEVGTKCWYLDQINDTLDSLDVGVNETKIAETVWNYTTRNLTDYGSQLEILSIVQDLIKMHNCTYESETEICQLLNEINSRTISILSNQLGYFPVWNATFFYWNNSYFVYWNSSIMSLGDNWQKLWNYWNCSESNNVVCSYLQAINSTTTNIRESQARNFRVIMSDNGEIVKGKNYTAKLFIYDYEGKPKDADESPSISLYSPLGSVFLSNANMTRVSEGVYSYSINTSSMSTGGEWEAIVSVKVNGTLVQSNDYWELEGSPPEVRINSVDSTIPYISADVTITNEGGGDYEYNYEYCVVSSSTETCGESTNLCYSSGSKLIHVGESWNTVFNCNINVPGDYWFKVLVYWGSEKSGASKYFEAKSKLKRKHTSHNYYVGETNQTNLTETEEQNTSQAVNISSNTSDKKEFYNKNEVINNSVFEFQDNGETSNNFSSFRVYCEVIENSKQLHKGDKLWVIMRIQPTASNHIERVRLEKLIYSLNSSSPIYNNSFNFYLYPSPTEMVSSIPISLKPGKYIFCNNLVYSNQSLMDCDSFSVSNEFNLFKFLSEFLFYFYLLASIILFVVVVIDYYKAKIEFVIHTPNLFVRNLFFLFALITFIQFILNHFVSSLGYGYYQFSVFGGLLILIFVILSLQIYNVVKIESLSKIGSRRLHGIKRSSKFDEFYHWILNHFIKH